MRSKKLLFVHILAALLLFSQITGQADIVHLKSGGSVEGKVEDIGDSFRISFDTGSFIIKKSDVKGIEPKALPKNEFYQRLSTVSEDVNGLMELASWAHSKNLKEEYVLTLRRVLQIDRTHQRANELLQNYQHRVNYLPYNETAAQKMLDDMGPEFKIRRTHHYRICYNSSDIYAEICGDLLEDVYSKFLYFFTDRHFKPAPITDRLEIVLFKNRKQYIQYASKIKPEFKNSAGFYKHKTNRCYFYDALDHRYNDDEHHWLSKLKKLEKDRKQVVKNGPDASYNQPLGNGDIRELTAQEALDLIDNDIRTAQSNLTNLKQRYDEYNISTCVHEAVHQLAFNCGIHSRLANTTPLWLIEGLAIYFEAANEGLWYGPGEVHKNRLEVFRKNSQSRYPLRLEKLLSDDYSLSLKHSGANSGYAASWALFYFLTNEYHEPFFDYIYHLSMQINYTDTSENRIQLFEQFFGDIHQIEQHWFHYMLNNVK